MQLLVLGCHRSGTSAVTRLLNMMGASVGAPESMKAANKENPKGFWENDEVVDINKLLLQQADARWDRLAGFTQEAAEIAFAQAAPTLGRELERLILRFDVLRPWVTKDPRLCLALPFWLPYLEAPVCILMNRHPVEVARSMHRRNKLLTVETGIALWEKYTLTMLADSRGVPRTSITHERLMREPGAVTGELLAALEANGVQGLRVPSEHEIAAFIDPKLHRERADAGTDEMNPAQRRLHEAMESGEALAWEEIPPLSAEAQVALEAYEASSTDEPERLLAVNRWNLGRLLDTRHELLETTRRAAKLQSELDRLGETAEQIRLLRKQVVEAQAQEERVRQKNAALMARDVALQAEVKSFREAIAAVYRETQTLENSMWTRLGVRVKMMRGALGLGALQLNLPGARARAIYDARMTEHTNRMREIDRPEPSGAKSGKRRPNRHAYLEDIDALKKVFEKLVDTIGAMDRQGWWRATFAARQPLWMLGLVSDSNLRTLAAAETLKGEGAKLFVQAAQRARRSQATRQELEQDRKALFQAIDAMRGHIAALEASIWWRGGVALRRRAGQAGLMKRGFRMPNEDAAIAMAEYKRIRDAIAAGKHRYVADDEPPVNVAEALPVVPHDRPLNAKVWILEPPDSGIDPAQAQGLIDSAGYDLSKFKVLASTMPDPAPAMTWQVVAHAELGAIIGELTQASDRDYRVLVRGDAKLPQGWLAAMLARAEEDPMFGLVKAGDAASAIKRNVMIKCGPVSGISMGAGAPLPLLKTTLADCGFLSVSCDLSSAATAPSIVKRPRAVDALLNLRIHTTSVFHRSVAELCTQSMENLDEAFRESEAAIVEHVLANRHAGGQPLVSIIMPAYNRKGIIESAVQSVLEQTWQHWELLVCDDGSDDGTADAVRMFGDARIHVLQLPHEGAARARNAGLAQARGEYIAYLDSDNLWHPAYLEVMTGQLMRHAGHYCVFAKYLDVVMESGGKMELKRHTDADFSYERLQERNFVDLNSFVHRVSLYRELGGFTGALPRMQDWDLVLKYTYLRDPLYVNAYLTFYRRNEAWGQITTSQRHLLEDARAMVMANLDSYYKGGLPDAGDAAAPRKVTIVSWDICRNHFSKAYNLAEALHASGRYQVQLIGFRFFEEPIFEPYEGVEAPFETAYFEGATLPEFEAAFARALMTVKGDLVYCVKPRFPSLGIGLLANYHFGKPLVMEANDSEVHVHKPGAKTEDTPLDPATADPADAAWRNPHGQEWSRMMDNFATQLPWIVTHNRNLHAHFGKRSFYIRNLKDETWYDPGRYDRAAVRKELGFKPTDRVILFGGLIRKHKGVFTLVDLVKDLGPQYKLLFVGSRNSPDLEALKKDHAKETIILPPQGRNEMARINYAADVVILWLDPDIPASHYQMPYKLTDALAMKVPVIANDISDLGTLGRQGYLRLVSYGNMNELKDAVQAVFDDPEESARMTEAGRRLYLRQFSYAAARRNFDLVYDAAMAEPAVLPPAAAFAEWYARVHEATKS